ncbi:aspartic peptidase domain-containing protein [Coprinopsis sp. MPI-PUGE-AT-0042]|nr:aspartic peptidase domain-containing protein [Coprinopsis sp. MPI-PUGE-AT-0042]
MAISTKSALMSAVVLLASTLSAEAAKISFHRSNVPHDARQLAARSLRVSRMTPSRISREQHIRLEAREDVLDPETQISMDLYTAPITMGGKEYTVVLDMSLADTWLDTAPPDGYEETDVKVVTTQTYSDGGLELDGTIGIAPLKFGTYEVAEQAFLNIHDDASELSKITGFNGFIGLGVSGFNPSPINDAIHADEGDDSETGRTILENIFAANSSMGRFVAVDLGRKDDTRDIEGINLSIGEYPEEWAEIQETPTIDLYNYAATGKWTALLDGASVGGVPVTLESSSSDVPKGSAIAQFSITEPDTYLPQALFDEVYGSITGAAGFTTEDGEKRWLVPCLAEDVLAFEIDDRSFPVHPLDVSEIWHDSDGKPDVLKDYTVCISSFRVMKNATDYDITLGSTFMRNVQAVFGYPTIEGGKVTEEPYLLLQADTEEDKARIQVTTIRGAKMQDLPAELTPEEAVPKIKSGGSSKSTSTKSSPNNKGKEVTDTDGDSDASDGSTKPGSNVLSTQGDVQSADSGLSKYMPATLGLLAANLLVALLLVALGVMNYIKRSGNAKKNNTGPHIYVPVKEEDRH